MITEGTRRFDLYDFFSILIPGAAFTIGLLPFLPAKSSVFSTALFGILIVIGFVFGRGIHASALLLESRFGTSHRDEFINELVNPVDIDRELIKQFYSNYTDTFEHGNLPSDYKDLDRDDHRYGINTMYGMVRSYIHMDARGRSRTFQAVLDFYRSVMVTSAFLATLYMVYAVLDGLQLLNQETIGYTSYLGSLNIHPYILFFGAAGLFGISYWLFERIRSNYRSYFVQYMMSDFILLQSVDEVSVTQESSPNEEP